MTYFLQLDPISESFSSIPKQQLGAKGRDTGACEGHLAFKSKQLLSGYSELYPRTCVVKPDSSCGSWDLVSTVSHRHSSGPRAASATVLYPEVYEFAVAVDMRPARRP